MGSVRRWCCFCYNIYEPKKLRLSLRNRMSKIQISFCVRLSSRLPSGFCSQAPSGLRKCAADCDRIWYRTSEAAKSCKLQREHKEADMFSVSRGTDSSEKTAREIFYEILGADFDKGRRNEDE